MYMCAQLFPVNDFMAFLFSRALAPGRCSGAQTMTDASASTSPALQVAVGYPVHQIENPWPLMAHMQGSRAAAIQVQHMKTLIVEVFILASIQMSLLFLCADYLRETNKQIEAFMRLSNGTVVW